MTHKPRKRFGQHFLHDQTVLQRLQNVINPQADQHIVEIGPGEGALTKLLYPYQQLDLIELDWDLAERLQRKFPQATVHAIDVLQFDFAKLGNNLKIVGNLPYNISSPLLFHLFSYIEHIHDMHFMLQKEVVLRMTAEVGDKNYNRLSVMTQYFCDNTLLFEIKPNAFNPPPKVDSAVIAMIPRSPTVIAKDINRLSQVVRIAFSKRRKTIHNCFKEIFTDAQLEQVGLKPSLRPQQLTVDDFVKLSNLLPHVAQ